MSFQITERIWTREEIEKAIQVQKARIIPDPPDELREIYEINLLIELAHLRAEKYDSPEHQEQLREIQEKNQSKTVPRNQQNPNYDQIIAIIHRLREGLDKETLEVKARAQQILEIMNQRKGLPSPTLSEKERANDPDSLKQSHCLRQLGLLKQLFLGIAPLMPVNIDAKDWEQQLSHLEEWQLGDDTQAAWDAVLDIRWAKNLSDCFNYFYNKYKRLS